MKAVVIEKFGATPELKEIDEPAIENSDQQIINVLAAPLKNYDRLRTSENFYGKFTKLPAVIGSDGVGALENGTRVYAFGISGMFAEKSIIAKSQYVILPELLDAAVAAALPNAVIGSAVPLRLRGNIRKGDTVLINGATGFTGQLAVQSAKYSGAEKIIATGRNEERLKKLKSLGATELISLNQSDEQIEEQLNAYLGETPVDIVLDYLWGHHAELFIDILHKGPTHPVRFINTGNTVETSIRINANTIRNSAIEIIGAGTGSYTKAEYALIFSQIIPEMYQLAAKGIISVNVQAESMADIEKIWNQKPEAGKRIVFTF